MKPHESLLRTFLKIHPEDAAHAFESLQYNDALAIFKKLPKTVASSLLSKLSANIGARLLAELEPLHAVELLTAISPHRASTFVQEFDEARRLQILDGMPERTASLLRELAQYPADSAGSMMEPRVTSLKIDFTAQQAIASIRKAPRETLHYLYVTDRQGKLVGILSLRELILASPRDAIESIVHRGVVSVKDTASRDEVVDLMQGRGFMALPVVDFDDHLIGIIKQTNALQGAQEEAFQDLQKFVGAGADERALSPVKVVVRSRLPWLYVNLLTAFMAAAVIGLFEGIIAEVAALAVLLPVVAGQGGNTGSQSLAVVMRGIALREIVPGVKKRVIAKELSGGLINGVLVAVVTAAAVFAWRMLKGDPSSDCGALALIIGLAMVVNMAAAALSGAAIPLLLKAIGRDPAQSASIFLTTVTDIVGFSSFLGFAVLFLPLGSGGS